MMLIDGPCVVKDETRWRYQRQRASDHFDGGTIVMAKPYVPYEGPIVTLAQARERGLTRYFTGKPCRRGHFSLRRVINQECTECAWKNRCREQRNALARETYDPAKARAYYLSRHDELKAAAVARYWADPETGKARVKAWRLEKPDQARATRQAWYFANKPLVKQRVAEWNEANPEATRCRGRNYRARSRAAEGSHTGEDIKTLFRRQRGKCVYCRVKLGDAYHVDHVVPLAKGGSNWPSNLQLLCRKCNINKRATDPLEYARRIGRLI